VCAKKKEKDDEDVKKLLKKMISENQDAIYQWHNSSLCQGSTRG